MILAVDVFHIHLLHFMSSREHREAVSLNHKRYMNSCVRLSLWCTSLCVRHGLTLVSNVCATASADILVLGPQRTQPITRSVYQFSFHLGKQINNGFFNWPIMMHTQILVHRWRPRRRVSALFQITWTEFTNSKNLDSLLINCWSSSLSCTSVLNN